MKGINESKRIEFTKVKHTSPLDALKGIMNGLVESSDDVIWSFDRVKPLDDTYCAVLTCPDILSEKLREAEFSGADDFANQILEEFGKNMQKDRAFEQYESANLSYAIVCEGPQKTCIDLDSALGYNDGHFRGLLFSDERFYHEDSGEFCDDDIMLSTEEVIELFENCKEMRIIITIRFE